MAGASKGKKVCLVGSGNWGSAIATIVGKNVVSKSNLFQDSVNMYVYEEQVEFGGSKRNLSEVINEVHENVKYMPGIKLPESVKAVPDLAEAASDAEILIWVVPHQFVKRLAPVVSANCRPDAIHISLIKGGIDIDAEKKEIELCSDLIKKSCNEQDCSVLMGANLANEVAEGQFCEATIGYNVEQNAYILQQLFDFPTFSVSTVKDVPGVELCGALKNIVALGAGFSDGCGWGCNTKSAIMRIGLKEMQNFVSHFFPDDSKPETFFESCGIADLITTCFGGRNRKCAEAFAKRVGSVPSSGDVNKKETWLEIEKELLNGQKLQGTLTCEEIVDVLREKKLEAQFPFITAVHSVAFHDANPKDFCTLMMSR